MRRTISAMVGKGSVNHNSRKFCAENVDGNRTHLNIDYCNENIKSVYHELFDEALKRYNDKQTRSDRHIENYYEKIRTGKQEKPFHELILQIGDKENMNAESENGNLAKKVLDEYYQEFQKRNPNLKVFSAHLHMDEATPHLHIDFVPYTKGSKRGLDTRVSLKQALAAQGFKGGTRGNTEWNQWVGSEKEQLAKVMERYKIEWEHKSIHETHLSVLDYKKQEREKEVIRLENKIECTDNILKNREELLSDVEKHIDKLDDEYQEKKSAASQIDEQITEKTAELTRTEEQLSENKAVLANSANKVSDIKSIENIQTKKSLFGDSITISQDDFLHISDLAKKHIAYEKKEKKLRAEISELKEKNSSLTEENSALKKENSSLKSIRNQINISALKNEIEEWKRKYQRVIDFVEGLGLKEKLETFLKPKNKNIRR